MSMPPPPGGPQTNINSSAFADELKQAVYDGFLMAMARSEGRSVSSFQGGQGYTVPPQGSAPTVDRPQGAAKLAPIPERPEFTRSGGGALSTLYAHGTSLLGHRVHVPGVQRINAELDNPVHRQTAQQQLDQEYQDARDHFNSLTGTGASPQVRRAAVNRLQSARAARTSDAALSARTNDIAAQSAKGIANSWGMKARAGLSGGLMGAGTEGGMLGGVAEALPGVGLGLMALQGGWEAANEVADQRAQNAQYQSIYGGSNLAGMGQRVQELGFRLTHVGDLSGQQAQEAFNGISQFGIQGTQRQQMLDTVVHEYNKYGLAISDTMKIVTTAIQNGNESLTGFKEAIDTVATSARQGGVNVGKMIQGLGTQLQTAAPLYGAGPGVMATQGAIAASASGAGQILGNALQQGQFGFYNSQQTMNLTVGMSGMSEGGLMALGQNPATAGQFAGIQQGSINQLLDETGILPIAMRAIQAYKAKNPSVSYQAMTASGVMSEIAVTFESMAGNQMYALQGIAQQMGINMDTTSLVQYVLQIALSRVSGGQAGWQYGMNQKTIGGIQDASRSTFQTATHRGSGAANSSGGYMGGNDQHGALTKNMKTALSDIGVKAQSLGFGPKGNWTADLNTEQLAYVNAFYDKGQSDSGVAGLLKSGKYNKTKFDVAGGPQGKTAAQLLDLYNQKKITQTQLDTATVTNNEPDKNIRGEELQYLGAGQTGGGSGKGGGGNVTFTLTPEAAQLIRTANLSGGVSQANANNLPATGNYSPGYAP